MQDAQHQGNSCDSRPGFFPTLTLCLLLIILPATCGAPEAGPAFHISLLLTAAAIFAALARQLQTNRLGITVRPGDSSHLALLAVILISMSASENGRPGIYVFWLFAAAFALYRLAGNICENRLASRLLISALAATGLMISAFGLIQYFFYLPAMRELFRNDPSALLTIMNLPPEAIGELKGRLDAQRTFATLVLPNTLAGYLLLPLPVVVFAAYSAIRMRREKNPAVTRAIVFASVATSTIILACFLLTRSKGAFASTLAIMVVAAALSGRAFIRLHWRKIAIVGFLLAFTIFAAHPKLGDYAGSGSVRTGYWRATVRMILAHPILGVGPGNFGSYYPQFMLPQDQETTMAHNCFLQIWAETGPAGALALLAALFAVGTALWRTAKNPAKVLPESESDVIHNKNDDNSLLLAGPVAAGVFFFVDIFILRIYYPPLGPSLVMLRRLYPLLAAGLVAIWIAAYFAVNAVIAAEEARNLRPPLPFALALGIGILGFLVHSAGDFDFYVPALTLTAWLAMGGIVSAGIRQKRLLDIKLSQGKRALVLVAAGLGLVMFVSWEIVPPIRTETAIRAAVDARSEAASLARHDPQQSRQILLDSLTELEAVRTVAPEDDRIYCNRAAIYFLLHSFGVRRLEDTDTLPAVLAGARKAIRLNPLDASARQLEAAALSESGDFIKAVESCRALVRLRPASPKSHWILGQALIRAERAISVESAGCFSRALELDKLQYSERSRLTPEMAHFAQEAIRNKMPDADKKDANAS